MFVTLERKEILIMASIQLCPYGHGWVGGSSDWYRPPIKLML